MSQTIAQRKAFARNHRDGMESHAPHYPSVPDNSGISAFPDVVSENRSQTNESSMDDKPFGVIRGVLWAITLEAAFAGIIFALAVCVLRAVRL